jgi:hypothetical protein
MQPTSLNSHSLTSLASGAIQSLKKTSLKFWFDFGAITASSAVVATKSFTPGAAVMQAELGLYHALCAVCEYRAASREGLSDTKKDCLKMRAINDGVLAILYLSCTAGFYSKTSLPCVDSQNSIHPL